MSATTTQPTPPPKIVAPREKISSWPVADRAAWLLCWIAGIGLCVIAGAIVIYMLVKGISYLKPSLFVTAPSASLSQTSSGGFSSPIIGTLVVTVIGTLIAAPIGICIAAWLVEYRRPAGLARAIESAVEMIAGAPSIVLALFGLLIFSKGFLAFLSQSTAGGALGQSFIVAGIVMSAIALPLVVTSTREGLLALPSRMRESSLALGKTRATTLRSVLLPSIRPNITTGVVLGMGRIIGDTAIIVVLLGSTLRNEPASEAPVLGFLRGTGSTLTSYVYNNSPAGEGNSPEKAYAAAFVLMIMVLVLNAAVARAAGGSGGGMFSSLTRRLGWTR